MKYAVAVYAWSIFKMLPASWHHHPMVSTVDPSVFKHVQESNRINWHLSGKRLTTSGDVPLPLTNAMFHCQKVIVHYNFGNIMLTHMCPQGITHNHRSNHTTKYEGLVRFLRSSACLVGGLMMWNSIAGFINYSYHLCMCVCARVCSHR